MNTCESCRFCCGDRSARDPLLNPNIPSSNKWLIVEHLDMRQQGIDSDCLCYAEKTPEYNKERT